MFRTISNFAWLTGLSLSQTLSLAAPPGQPVFKARSLTSPAQKQTPVEVQGTLSRVPGSRGFQLHLQNVSSHAIAVPKYRPLYEVRLFDAKHHKLSDKSTALQRIDIPTSTPADWIVLPPHTGTDIPLCALLADGSTTIPDNARCADCVGENWPIRTSPAIKRAGIPMRFFTQSPMIDLRVPNPFRHPQEQERDVTEVVFRSLLPVAQQNSRWKGVRTIFLRQQRKDPDALLLQRFQNNSLPVKAVSASTRGRKWWVEDRATGQKGVILSVDRLHWINATKAEVQGGFFLEGKSGMNATFSVIYQGNQWKVEQMNVTDVF